jgi:hypothetical protein
MYIPDSQLANIIFPFSANIMNSFVLSLGLLFALILALRGHFVEAGSDGGKLADHMGGLFERGFLASPAHFCATSLLTYRPE